MQQVLSVQLQHRGKSAATERRRPPPTRIASKEEEIYSERTERKLQKTTSKDFGLLGRRVLLEVRGGGTRCWVDIPDLACVPPPFPLRQFFGTFCLFPTHCYRTPTDDIGTEPEPPSNPGKSEPLFTCYVCRFCIQEGAMAHPSA
jgi:hypothetical protein